MIRLAMMLLLACSPGWAQSLGDFARQQRDLRAKEGIKPVKIYTNDNLPSRPLGESPTAATGISVLSSKPTTETTGKSGAASSTATSAEGAGQAKQAETSTEKPEDKQKTKEYWQGRFQAVRGRLSGAEEQQRLAEDELNLLQIQQAREISPAVQSEIGPKIAAKQDEVTSKRAETDKARKALADLENEFKDSGAPEDWSKTSE